MSEASTGAVCFLVFCAAHRLDGLAEESTRPFLPEIGSRAKDARDITPYAMLQIPRFQQATAWLQPHISSASEPGKPTCILHSTEAWVSNYSGLADR
jgi:hypothetical protein